MTKRSQTFVVCDICGVEVECGRYENPPDPWLSIAISGYWVTDFGRTAEADLNACGPTCALGLLEKATKKMQRLAKRFPSVMSAGVKQ